ncbi:MAG TPA: hypothetical protein DER60_11165 [Syntrophomonas sp.]|jgi:hypothetical protein|nr:hypothetical protein [Syntrophomonas sp.]
MRRNPIVYLVYMFLITIILTTSQIPLAHIKLLSIQSYALTLFYLAQFVLYLLIGIILGFCEHLLFEIHKSGVWRINFQKFFILGIPLGLIASSYLFYFQTEIPFIINLFSFIVNTESGQVVVAQSILGYTLITSFFKDDRI